MIQINAIVMMQANTNMIVYQGIAFSGVYAPNAASGVEPNFASNHFHLGYVYFISKLYAYSPKYWFTSRPIIGACSTASWAFSACSARKANINTIPLD